MERQNGNIETTLAAYIQEECLSRSSRVELDYGLNLFDAGIVDSAGLISYIGFIEKTFGINIPDEDLLPENFVSINAIADYVRVHQKVGYGVTEEMPGVGSR
jgi:acyl carrier protein